MTEALAVSPNSEMPAEHDVSPLAIDVPCSRCSYDLRGLTADMNCPECGTPVSRSCLGNWLRFADPDWVGKLRKGMSLKLYNILAGLLMGIVVAIATFAFGRPEIAAVLVAVFGGILGAWSVFLITAPEPAVGATEVSVTLRKVLRSAVLAGIALNVVQHSRIVAGQMVLMMSLGVLAGCAGIVVSFGELVYLRRFARRIPDETLARSTGTVLYGQIICGAILLLAALVLGGATFLAGSPTVTTSATATGQGVTVSAKMSLTPTVPVVVAGPTPPGPLVIIAGLLGLLGGLGTLVFGIWYLILIVRYRRAFRLAESEAIALSLPQARPVVSLGT